MVCSKFSFSSLQCFLSFVAHNRNQKYFPGSPYLHRKFSQPQDSFWNLQHPPDGVGGIESKSATTSPYARKRFQTTIPIADQTQCTRPVGNTSPIGQLNYSNRSENRLSIKQFTIAQYSNDSIINKVSIAIKVNEIDRPIAQIHFLATYRNINSIIHRHMNHPMSIYHQTIHRIHRLATIQIIQHTSHKQIKIVKRIRSSIPIRIIGKYRQHHQTFTMNTVVAIRVTVIRTCIVIIYMDEQCRKWMGKVMWKKV